MTRFAAALMAATLMSACAAAPMTASAQQQPGGPFMNPPMSTIQPETTITLTGRGTVAHAPDIATITLGVQVEAETAATAMSQQRERMNAVFAAVRASGIADRDIQTSNLSLNPVYDYPNNQRPRLRAYNASNQVMIRVRDLTKLGPTLDAVVNAGGNTINGVGFGIDKPEPLQDEARIEAIQNATARAELYAKAVGYRVKRIVTISEQEFYSPPPMPMMAMRAEMAQDSTPVSGGEMEIAANVSVTFELER